MTRLSLLMLFFRSLTPRMKHLGRNMLEMEVTTRGRAITAKMIWCWGWGQVWREHRSTTRIRAWESRSLRKRQRKSLLKGPVRKEMKGMFTWTQLIFHLRKLTSSSTSFSKKASLTILMKIIWFLQDIWVCIALRSHLWFRSSLSRQNNFLRTVQEHITTTRTILTTVLNYNTLQRLKTSVLETLQEIVTLNCLKTQEQKEGREKLA